MLQTDNRMSNSLKSSNPLPARFYGLPKIHKPNNPLRLIVSFCGSLTYNLVSFYNDVISKNINPSISRIENSFDFIEKVKNTKIPPGYKIISLDAIRTCSTNSAFNYQGIFFKQKSGFPMGTPVSPIVADIVMDDLEKNA